MGGRGGGGGHVLIELIEDLDTVVAFQSRFVFDLFGKNTLY